MPELRNYTPYANFRYYSLDNQGAEFGVVIVKATFELTEDGRLEVSGEQAPLVMTDRCHGAVNETSLRHPSDLVPYKPQGELLVNAVAHAPGGEPSPSWLCGLSMEGGGHRLEKALRVTGQRWWMPTWARELEPHEADDWQAHREDFEGWRLGEPEPALSVPLRWEHAYGGEMPRALLEDGAALIDANEHNPLGVGWIDEETTNCVHPVPAPRIEDPDHPVSDPYEELVPQGLAPIPPAWLPRRPLGGTYDANWVENVWPNWPADYDFAYHLSSPQGMRWPSFFSGRERLWLRNLLPGGGEVALTLPGVGVEARFVEPHGGRDSRRMSLDTVFLDLAVEPPEPRRVYLSWRTRFEPGKFERVELGVIEEESS